VRSQESSPGLRCEADADFNSSSVLTQEQTKAGQPSGTGGINEMVAASRNLRGFSMVYAPMAWNSVSLADAVSQRSSDTVWMEYLGAGSCSIGA
jgi:hypothetical protein